MDDKLGKTVLKMDSLTCFGCSACLGICPTGAISLVADSEGFQIPRIDEKKCILCGKCGKVCPSIHKWKNTLAKKTDKIEIFSFQNRNLKILEKSTSGGLFRAAADRMLDMGGLVCGCIIDDRMAVKHAITDNPKIVDRMMGSKYVQSDMNTCFCKINQYLKNGKNILFSGTSCQVHGLINYLNYNCTKQDNLICMDLICHGVPSPKVFNDFLHFYEEVAGTEIIDYKFRSKKYGWGIGLGDKNYINTVYRSDNQVDDLSYCGQLWKNIFFSNYCIRNCCYCCSYACVQKPADISVGDFWGIEKQNTGADWSKGCSMVIPQTEKGFDFFRTLEADIDKMPNGFKAAQMQNRLFSSVNKPDNRDAFWKIYQSESFKVVAKQFFRFNGYYKTKYALREFMTNYGIERIANKLLGDVFY